jgi:hypothetical protein
MTFPVERLDAEARWADLARDLVHMTLPNPGGHRPLAEVLGAYRLGADDLASIIAAPRFKALLEAEAARAKELGHRAGYVFRAEALLSLLAERMFVLAMGDDATPTDVIRTFTAILQSVGGVEAGRQSGGPVTNIQINVPRLDNPKLRHLDGVPLQAD